MNIKAIIALFLAHFTGDFFQSFFQPLYPVFRDQFGLNLTQVGMITGVVTFASFITQPVTGYLADRHSPRLYLFAGLGLSVVFIPLTGVMPSYWLLLLAGGLGAFGSSLYHPAAAGMVAGHAPGRTALGMSLFGMGGTLAFSLGPLLITLYVTHLGLGRLPLLGLAGALLFLAVLLLLPRTDTHRPDPGKKKERISTGLAGLWTPVLALWLIGSLRSLLDAAMRSFYPILHVDKGHSLVSAGLVLTLYMLGGTLSAVVCGQYADRKGYRRLFLASFLVSPVCLLLFLQVSGFWVYPCAFIFGFALLATIFPALALATKIAPMSRTLASSLAFGFATGTGGLLAPGVGRLAEIFGLLPVMRVLALVPLLCLALMPLVFAGQNGWKE